MPEINVDVLGTAAVIHYQGKISFKEKAQLEETVHNTLDDSRVHNIVIDLESVDFIDSSGISILLNTYQLTFRQKKGFYLYGAADKIYEIFDALNLKSYFTILNENEYLSMTGQ